MLACSPKSVTPSTFLLTTSLFFFTMIFTSLALLSGMVLVSNAAPFSSRADPVVHVVSVSNAAGALAYDPPFIVSQPSGHYVSTVVLTRLSFRPPRPGTSSRSNSFPRTTR